MFLGIDVGGTNLKIVVLNEMYDIVYHNEVTNLDTKNFDRLVANIKEEVEKAGNPADFESIGLGIAGHINHRTGVINFSPNLKYLNKKNIARPLSEIFQKQVFVDNDVNCFAYGEFLLGAGRGSTNMVGLTIGTGIGGGLIINGQIYRGSNFLAGELGHISVDANGRQCACGGYGCVERYVSRDGLISDALLHYNAGTKIYELSAGNKKNVTPKLIVDAASQGDLDAIAIIDKAALYFATLINSVNNILDPDVFVVGGGIAQAGDIFLSRVKTYFSDRVYGGKNLKPIKTAELGTRAGAVGAALMAAQETKNMGKQR